MSVELYFEHLGTATDALGVKKWKEDAAMFRTDWFPSISRLSRHSKVHVGR